MPTRASAAPFRSITWQPLFTNTCPASLTPRATAMAPV